VPDRLSPNDTERLNHPKKRKKKPSLTEAERQRLRAVLKNLRHLHGSWNRVAEITGVNVNTIYGIAKSMDFGSMSVAVRVARAAKMPVEHLLDGTLWSANHCRYCGQPLPKPNP
jgi:hypothetical protein